MLTGESLQRRLCRRGLVRRKREVDVVATLDQRGDDPAERPQLDIGLHGDEDLHGASRPVYRPHGHRSMIARARPDSRSSTERKSGAHSVEPVRWECSRRMIRVTGDGLTATAFTPDLLSSKATVV